MHNPVQVTLKVPGLHQIQIFMLWAIKLNMIKNRIETIYRFKKPKHDAYPKKNSLD